MAVDFALMARAIAASVRPTGLLETALIALRARSRPQLGSARARRGSDTLPFMSAKAARLGNPTFVSRSGYTGEDGYDILLASSEAELAQPAVESDGRRTDQAFSGAIR